MKKLSVVIIVILALLAAVALVVGVLACGLCRQGRADGQPTVRLLSPPEGTQIAVGRQIYIQARAFARGGIARIDFAVNGASVASQSPSGSQRLFATAQPWTAPSAGTYTLSATAYDAEGQASAPAQVTVTVLEPGSFAQPGATPPSGVGVTPPGGGQVGWPEPVVDFRADRTSLQAGECTTLRWDAEYVQEVYLDGTGVAGHGTRDVCPLQTQTYVLHVILPSGESQDYTVTIQVTGESQATGPDLAVLAVACPGGQSDEAIPFQTEVMNAGDAVAQNAQWRWSVNAADADPGQWNQGGTFTLDPGATTLLQGSIPALAAGNWTVYVEVRVDGETVTGNNRGSARFAVSEAGTNLPDLVARDLVVSPGTVQPGARYSASWTVVNQGSGQADPSTARFELAGVGRVWDCQVPALAPGQSHRCEFPQNLAVVAPDRPGTYAVWAIADAGGTIAESDEGNNQASVNLAVPTPVAGEADLAVQVSCPGERELGQNIPFQVQVRNVGDLPANGATWSWTIAPTGQDAGANWLVGGSFSLAAGQSTTLNGTASVQQAGDWTVHVMVSLDGEANTNNNAGSCRVTVSAAAAPGQVTLASVSVNPTSFTGSCPRTVTFNGSITTDGPATVRYQWVRGVAAGSIRTITFDAAGTQTVTGDWTLNQSGTYEMYLHIIEPNDTRSNVARYTLTCTEGSLSRPTNLRVVGRSKTGIRLQWDDNSNGETGFSVEISPPPHTDWGIAESVSGNTTTVQITGLTCGQTYRFRVRAYNDDGFSEYSNEVEGSTMDCD